MDAVPAVITGSHKEDLRIFHEYNNVEKSCKKGVTRLVPEMYYRTLKKITKDSQIGHALKFLPTYGQNTAR